MQAPSTPPAALPTSKKLAIASLVYGILGFLTGPFTGIPAIITGHIARSRITKAGTKNQGKSLATAGLVLGYITTILSLFVSPTASIKKARKVTALATAMAIESAVENFYTEYGSLPSNESTDTVLRTDKDTEFVRILLGPENQGPEQLSIQSPRFLTIREGKSGKNGLIRAPDSGKIIGIFDPWGGPYHVAIDLDYDEKLSIPSSSGTTITLKGRRAAVWSDGPDRKSNTSDDVRTW